MDLGRLEQISRLRESGVLTDEEFQQEKAKLLAPERAQSVGIGRTTLLAGAAILAALAIGLAVYMTIFRGITEVTSTGRPLATTSADSIKQQKNEPVAAASPTPTPVAADRKNDPENTMEKPIELTAKWLIGTWAGAEHNPSNNPSASCDTDVTITFKQGSRFEDGGAAGRFRTNGRSIIYYNRVSVADIADPESDPGGAPLKDVKAVARAIDRNTFKEGSGLWRRCASG